MATKIEKDKYTKDEIKRASSLNYNVDLLEVLLEDGKEYSLDDVKALVDKFTDRKVEI